MPPTPQNYSLPTTVSAFYSSLEDQLYFSHHIKCSCLHLYAVSSSRKSSLPLPHVPIPNYICLENMNSKSQRHLKNLLLRDAWIDVSSQLLPAWYYPLNCASIVHTHHSEMCPFSLCVWLTYRTVSSFKFRDYLSPQCLMWCLNPIKYSQFVCGINERGEIKWKKLGPNWVVSVESLKVFN